MEQTKTNLLQNALSQPIIQVVFASLLLGFCAQIKIPLSFTPVAFSLQTLVLMCLGGVMGFKKSAAAVLLYIFEGSVGLPFFYGGASGVTHLLGPTFGYIVGFLVQASIAGLYVDYTKKFSYFGCLLACSISSVVQLGMGAAWLGLFVGFESILAKGVFPFIPLEIVKIMMAVPFISLSQSWRLR